MAPECNDYCQSYHDEDVEQTMLYFLVQCAGIGDIRKKPVFVCLDDVSAIELRLLIYSLH